MAETLVGHLGVAWQPAAFAAAAAVHVALLLGLVLTAVAVMIWMERKVAARIQDRLGPTRVGWRFGWLQSPADGLKLLCKEDIVPAEADALLFRAAPYWGLCAALCAFLVIPLADDWVALRPNAGVFFLLAVSGLEIFAVLLGGYASASKWSLIGAMREAAQVVSYEIPLALCLVIPVMIAGSMDLVEIVERQSGALWNWNLFHDPFTFAAFWVFVTCAVANCNRAPFDLPEADTELVAGFMTEYSGFRWSLFMLAEYAALLALSALAAALFLGGWHGPLPLAAWLGLAGEAPPWAAFVGKLLGLGVFLLKTFAGVAFAMWARWTLPRLRIDQVLATCLKYCIPLAAAMLLGATLWLFALGG